jgi:hypothetical protein
MDGPAEGTCPVLETDCSSTRSDDVEIYLRLPCVFMACCLCVGSNLLFYPITHTNVTHSLFILYLAHEIFMENHCVDSF